jgi:hypothetical protein
MNLNTASTTIILISSLIPKLSSYPLLIYLVYSAEIPRKQAVPLKQQQAL